jgi:hypothetical protein
MTEEISDAAKKFGKTAITGTLGIGTTAIKTAQGIGEGLGETGVAVTHVAKHTVKGISNVTENLSDTAKGYTDRNKMYQDAETDVYGVKSTSDAETNKIRIQNELEQKKIKAEIDQERKIAALSKQKTLSKQEQDENHDKVDISYYYGFKTDDSPYEAGKTASSVYFSFDKTWYFYFYPTYFIDDKGEFHEITLPPKGIDGGRREKKIIVHDNTANTDIFIDFVRTAGKIYGDLMVPKITDVVSGVEIPIKKLQFAKGWCYILKMVGGKRRKSNKQTIRRRKTNKRRSNRRKTNKKTNRRIR